MAIPSLAKHAAEDYLTAEIKQIDRTLFRPGGHPMLYIFARNNSLQIAWGSRAPRKGVESRSSQLDTSIARMGFIRTRNAG